MLIEFIRGWDPYLPGRSYDLPPALAEIHIELGRARKVEAPVERKDPEPPHRGKAPLRRR